MTQNLGKEKKMRFALIIENKVFLTSNFGLGFLALSLLSPFLSRLALRRSVLLCNTNWNEGEKKKKSGGAGRAASPEKKSREEEEKTLAGEERRKSDEIGREEGEKREISRKKMK